MKHLYLKFKDNQGKWWLLDAEKIAEDRANYYASVDGYEFESDAWKEEVQFAMDNPYELEDWLYNNTDPIDFAPYFVFYAQEEKEAKEEMWEDFHDLEFVTKEEITNE